nr:hypothetical protein [Candidatus Thiosymbion oneisti]
MTKTIFPKQSHGDVADRAIDIDAEVALSKGFGGGELTLAATAGVQLQYGYQADAGCSLTLKVVQESYGRIEISGNIDQDIGIDQDMGSH